MRALEVLFSTGKRRLYASAGLPAIIVFVSLCAACAPEAQTFEARLSPFPVIGGNAGGSGEATATLTGTTLQVAGSFEALSYRAGRGGETSPSVATSARLHAGPVTAVSGDAFADLSLDAQGDRGAISGTVELTAEQVDMLRNGQVYAQISTEETPDGHLWGWFLQ